MLGHQARVLLVLHQAYDAESGSIHIDGQNIVTKQNSLRRNISMVTQEASMFNRTARENILYGKPDASEEEVVDAAKKLERTNSS